MKQWLKPAVVLVMACVALCSLQLEAQRRVTPVTNSQPELQGKNENKNPADSIDYSKVVRMRDDRGREILVDTISGREVPDTAKTSIKVAKNKQPLMFATAVGFNLWDPVMLFFGQNFTSFEVSGELNLHNRYIPVVEVGVGRSNYRPDDNNYTYHVPLTPFVRVGFNYNFLYNGNTDYMAFAGVRYGLSRFNYEINNVTLDDSYWGEETTFNIPKQSTTVSYLHVLFGIRVKVWKQLSFGWNLRYKAKLHESKSTYGNPWYIPGYGSRNGALTGAFYVTYTLPFKQKTTEVLPAALAQ
jgi:hypothetical protein